MAPGAMPDVRGAERAALPDEPLPRQAVGGAARRARLAAAVVPDLQGAARGAVQDADRPASRPAAHRASSPWAAGAVRRAGVWEELERWEATTALVRFSGGGNSPGSIAAVTLEDASGRTLARWQSGEGELPEALATPIWGRYALFRGHPRIAGLLMWDVRERQVVIAGERGGEKFEELLSAPRPLGRRPVTPVAAGAGAVSRGSAARAHRATPARAGEGSRSCERCGEPLAAGLRAEARYCSKRCRQAASRARLKDRPPFPPPRATEACAWCEGPMPAGVRIEARFCSKRCRQASSRHALRIRPSSPQTSGPHSTSHARPAVTRAAAADAVRARGGR